MISNGIIDIEAKFSDILKTSKINRYSFNKHKNL